jgi:hypothetical protein
MAETARPASKACQPAERHAKMGAVVGGAIAGAHAPGRLEFYFG